MDFADKSHSNYGQTSFKFKLKNHWNNGWISQIIKGLQISSELLKIQNRSIPQIRKDCNYDQISLNSSYKIIETTQKKIFLQKLKKQRLDLSDKEGLQLWSDLIQIHNKKLKKQRLDFSDKKGLQLWSDFLEIQDEKSFKQRWDLSDKKGLQLWSDLLKFQAEKSLKRLHFSDKKVLQLWSHFP